MTKPDYLRISGRKPQTKKDRIAFLKSHYAYDRSPWPFGGNVAFAHNVKLTHLPLSWDAREKCFEALGDEIAFLVAVEPVLNYFAEEHPGWEIYSAGRSGGYLTLVPHDGHNYMHLQEDFADMTGADVKELADLVWDFDLACEEAVESFVEFAVSAELVQE